MIVSNTSMILIVYFEYEVRKGSRIYSDFREVSKKHFFFTQMKWDKLTVWSLDYSTVLDR